MAPSSRATHLTCFAKSSQTKTRVRRHCPTFPDEEVQVRGPRSRQSSQRGPLSQLRACPSISGSFVVAAPCLSAALSLGSKWKKDFPLSKCHQPGMTAALMCFSESLARGLPRNQHCSKSCCSRHQAPVVTPHK